MSNPFRAIGLSFKKTPVKVREQLSMDESASKRLMVFMKDYNCSELIVISTCNRTEFYYSADELAKEALITGISILNNVEKADFLPYLVYFDEHEAVNHLFRVAIGLEAQVVGDLHIINQVKKAYQWSSDEMMAGPYLHRLMHCIFYTNKKVAHETAFKDGAASLSYTVKDLAENLTKEIIAPKILLIGLGEIGTDIARNFSANTRAEIYVTNRTRAKAEAIAGELNYNFIAWDDYLKFINEADVIISSVAVSQPIITPRLFQKIQLFTPKFFIDLSMPRSVAENLEEVDGAIVYNIDEIENQTSETIQRRLQEVPGVEKIIKDAIKDFHSWAKEMAISPTIKKLENALEQIRQEELARYLKNSDTREAKVLDDLSKRMMQKMIKFPVLQLKAACQRGEADKLIDLLHDLFDLKEACIKK